MKAEGERVCSKVKETEHNKNFLGEREEREGVACLRFFFSFFFWGKLTVC